MSMPGIPVGGNGVYLGGSNMEVAVLNDRIIMSRRQRQSLVAVGGAALLVGAFGLVASSQMRALAGKDQPLRVQVVEAQAEESPQGPRTVDALSGIETGRNGSGLLRAVVEADDDERPAPRRDSTTTSATSSTSATTSTVTIPDVTLPEPTIPDVTLPEPTVPETTIPDPDVTTVITTGTTAPWPIDCQKWREHSEAAYQMLCTVTTFPPVVTRPPITVTVPSLPAPPQPLPVDRSSSPLGQ